ncbi:MAG: hypothetical protein AAB459_01975 [Patescibacteria group bacterium]
MFWIISLLVAGSIYASVDRLFSIFALSTFALGIVLLAGILIFMWVNDRTGINRFMVESFQFLSGVDTPGGIISNCESPKLLGLIIGMVLALFNFIPGLIAFFALPIGSIGTLGASIYALISHDSEGLKYCSGILALGLFCLVLAGLIMRLMHYVDGALICPV